MMRRLCAALLLMGLVACDDATSVGRVDDGRTVAPVVDATTVDANPDALVDEGRDAVTDTGPDVTTCPPRSFPAKFGGVSHAEVNAEQAGRWLAYRSAREQQRLAGALDPTEVWAAHRIEQAEIDNGCVSLPELVDLGRALFIRGHTREDGLSGRFNRAQGRSGRPDAFRCVDCHWKGGFAGAGDRADNAFFFGDGDDLASSDVRNPPALWGAGWTQRIAEEMTDELQAQAASTPPGATSLLSAKGVAFGQLTLDDEGVWDTSGVVGVDPDLVVRPFGWKGTFTSLREFSATSLNGHFGIQSDAILRAPNGADLGDGPLGDPDEDGVVREFTDGQMTALVVFLATLDTPQVAVPAEGDASAPLTAETEIVSTPEFVIRWLDGANHFDALGCSGCHVPFMEVSDATWTTEVEGSAYSVDLAGQAARPHPEKQGVTWLVPVFSDFKRHQMGEWLAGRHTERGVPPSVYMTRRLWGLAGTPPYLHDARATTIDEAVFMHGGPGSEAAFAASNFDALSEGEKASLRVFLASLRRAPAIRVR